jgi:hypothetical protein
MLKAILKPLVSSVLLIASQACAPPGGVPPDPNTILFSPFTRMILQIGMAATHQRQWAACLPERSFY